MSQPKDSMPPLCAAPPSAKRFAATPPTPMLFRYYVAPKECSHWLMGGRSSCMPPAINWEGVQCRALLRSSSNQAPALLTCQRFNYHCSLCSFPWHSSCRRHTSSVWLGAGAVRFFSPVVSCHAILQSALGCNYRPNGSTLRLGTECVRRSSTESRTICTAISTALRASHFQYITSCWRPINNTCETRLYAHIDSITRLLTPMVSGDQRVPMWSWNCALHG